MTIFRILPRSRWRSLEFRDLLNTLSAETREAAIREIKDLLWRRVEQLKERRREILADLFNAAEAKLGEVIERDKRASTEAPVGLERVFAGSSRILTVTELVPRAHPRAMTIETTLAPRHPRANSGRAPGRVGAALLGPHSLLPPPLEGPRPGTRGHPHRRRHPQAPGDPQERLRGQACGSIPPFGDYQGDFAAVRVQASSGTSGNPKPFFFTRNDWDIIGRLWSRRFHAQGVREGDILQIVFAYTLFIVGFTATEGGHAAGGAGGAHGQRQRHPERAAGEDRPGLGRHRAGGDPVLRAPPGRRGRAAGIRPPEGLSAAPHHPYLRDHDRAGQAGHREPLGRVRLRQLRQRRDRRPLLRVATNGTATTSTRMPTSSRCWIRPPTSRFRREARACWWSPASSRRRRR